MLKSNLITGRMNYSRHLWLILPRETDQNIILGAAPHEGLLTLLGAAPDKGLLTLLGAAPHMALLTLLGAAPHEALLLNFNPEQHWIIIPSRQFWDHRR